MQDKVLPPSPSWYCSNIIASNSSEYFVFGARHYVYIFGCDQYPPKFKGVFISHKEKVTALALCDHDEYCMLCVSAAEDGAVKLWNMENRTVQSEHGMHTHRVTCICWSPTQSDLIVSGDEHGAIGVWQLDGNKQAAHRPEKGSILCVSASPSTPGLFAFGYKTGQINIINVKQGGMIVSRLRGHDEEVYSLSWCPEPGENFKPEPTTQDITDLESFGVEDSWRKKPAMVDTGGGFGTDGWLLASSSKDKTIRIWSTSKGRQLSLLKLPSAGRRDRSDDAGKSRIWVTLLWSPHFANNIISGSISGDILLWDITKSGKVKHKSFSGRGHSRFAFNLCLLGREKKYMCSVSMDRQLIFWDVDLQCQIGIMHTFGGYVYTLQTSPLDPGRIAFGVGDNTIRLLKLGSSTDFYDMTQYWQGIRGKVTALSWHPLKEGLLAYGTEDGRVGIYDTLSHKAPQISTTYHRRTVYVVTWGPPSVSNEQDGGTGSHGYHLYSCGDGNVLEHLPRKLDKEALSVGQLIQASNPAYRAGTRVPTRSEISWNPDFTMVAIGNDDGTVEFYQAETFSLVAVVQVHHKLVNCVVWHPHVTMETPNGSIYKHYVALGSNENSVCVLDMRSIFGSNVNQQTVHTSESWRRLESHTSRITGLAWSPHIDGMLVSVSYDGNALVWNVADSQVLACYQGHLGKLLCCQWNGLDPTEVITGGDDFSVHIWKYEDHPFKPEQLEVKKRKRKKEKTKSGTNAVMTLTDATAVPKDDGLDTNTVTTYSEQKMLEQLLEEKRQELVAQKKEEEGDAVTEESMKQDDTVKVEDLDLDVQTTLIKQPTSRKDLSWTKGELNKRKAKKMKSIFPEYSKRESRGKKYVLEDIERLAKIIYEDKPLVDYGPDIAHLGLFLDRRATYALLRIEGEYHRNNDNMDYFYQLEIWKGNINGALRVARQRDELSDWLVAMAPMASYDTWTSVCEDYALQLEADGQYHKAASYFLACHKVYEAIRLFKRHKLFKEAIALAKARLSPLDPALEELYTLWAQQLTKDGNYEQAAKCHLAMKQVQDAAKLLARRYDQSNLRAAAHISMIGNDKQQGLMYTQKLVQQHLLQHEWRDTYDFLKEKKDLQVYLATSSMHEMLCCELSKLGIHSIDQERLTKWDQQSSPKIHLPDFILDPGDVDVLSPWQQHLVRGHTFPHHVLRIWYNHFDIAMDTTSVEDMYKTLCLLHAGRQSQVELSQILIQVCTDLTLCMLSLMMSETPTAMSHLLQAIGSLHEAGHVHIMHGLLRLFLPQGPKYILKLQQEVTAMRVMISMDTHTHVDGASKVHTIKRYLSEHKDDSVINTSSLRCRELDCLRAYYYVAILDFLKESCFSGEATLRENIESKGGKKQNKLGKSSEASKLQPCTSLDENANADDELKKADLENGNTGLETKLNRSDSKLCHSEELGVIKVPASVSDASVTDSKSVDSVDSVRTDSADTDVTNVLGKTVDAVKDVNTKTIDSVEDSYTIKDLEASGEPCSVKPKLPVPAMSPTIAAKSQTAPAISPTAPAKSQTSPTISPTAPAKLQTSHTIPQTVPNINHYIITVSQLAQLSRGILWDLQAKRYALTETLGYIHKAISQLLLSKNTQPSEATESVVNKDRSSDRTDSQEEISAENNQAKTEANGASGGDPRVDDNTYGCSDLGAGNKNLDNQSVPEGAVTMATEKSFKSDNQINPGTVLDHQHVHMCPHHQHESHVEGHICQSVLTHHFDQIMNIHVPHVGDVPIHNETDTELKCSYFEVCSACELLHKSRKILFEDEPRFHTRPDVGFKDMTTITNPAKYINVPDEWYGMPVDQKYSKRYITMAILKEEQEYVMGELKRGPDSTQSPFPNPLEVVGVLLDLAYHSAHVSSVERQEYVQKVVTWALNFAVTTQQKQTFVDMLQSHLET